MKQQELIVIRIDAFEKRVSNRQCGQAAFIAQRTLHFSLGCSKIGPEHVVQCPSQFRISALPNLLGSATVLRLLAVPGRAHVVQDIRLPARQVTPL